jgi:formylmethanofuran dehydrogenase subunit E
MRELDELLQSCAALHARLCPRQVLGARMGCYAGALLGLELPQQDKRLLVIVETDGCAADGIAVATGCSVGRRTLRVEDYGKVAATFVDTYTERAVRLVPRVQARQRAQLYAPAKASRWEAQLIGYQRMPDDELLARQWVQRVSPLQELLGNADSRAECKMCGEEIINGREVALKGNVLCRSCAGQSYFRSAMSAEYAVPSFALAKVSAPE